MPPTTVNIISSKGYAASNPVNRPPVITQSTINERQHQPAMPNADTVLKKLNANWMLSRDLILPSREELLHVI